MGARGASCFGVLLWSLLGVGVSLLASGLPRAFGGSLVGVFFRAVVEALLALAFWRLVGRASKLFRLPVVLTLSS